MNQAEVKKHITAGTPLAVMGYSVGTEESPSNRAGRFQLGGQWLGLEQQTQVVPLRLEPRFVQVMMGSGRASRLGKREMPCVEVRLNDGSTGWVTPRAISGTWAEWEEFRDAWKARAERETLERETKEERTRAAAEAIGGRPQGSGVLLTLERAEELAGLAKFAEEATASLGAAIRAALPEPDGPTATALEDVAECLRAISGALPVLEAHDAE